MKRKIHLLGILVLGISFLCANFGMAVPSKEVAEGGTDLFSYTKDWKEITKWNQHYNKLALDQLTQILEKLRGMRQTAKKMGTDIPLDRHSSLLAGEKQTTLHWRELKDFDDEEMEEELDELDKVLEEVLLPNKEAQEEDDLTSYVSLGGEIKVVNPLKQPIYKQITDSQTSGKTRTQDLILKVAQKIKKNMDQQMDPYELSNMLLDMAEALLPPQLLNQFDAHKTAKILLKRSGIIQIGDGITVRPAVPQDYAYVEFANLGNNLTDETLFWSDPMVVNGYHPILGTAMNRTDLFGYRSLDMDHVTTRGLSGMINQINRMRPRDKQIKNPLRGYASTVIPGLIVMGEQGRLEPGEDPTSEQLKDAKALSKKLKMLPTQFMRSPMRRISFSPASKINYACLSEEKIRFRYPQLILVDNTTGESIDTELVKLNKKTFENIMKLNKKRLLEIIKLKNENKDARKFIGELLKSYQDIESATANIADGMSGKTSIPQVTQLRKDVFANIEEARWMLSHLHFEYDKLKQKEWEVLTKILETQQEYIHKQEDSASIRTRIALEKKNQEQSSE
ncbi:MAG: hypothetical protein ACOY3I_07140 [Verrucomicrobiota bacterium]